jgi:hypothetical protein
LRKAGPHEARAFASRLGASRFAQADALALAWRFALDAAMAPIPVLANCGADKIKVD